MQCLWLTLADPEPATNGQLIYSKGLIEAARGAGATLRVIGLARPRESRRSVANAAASTGGWPTNRPQIAVAAAAVAPCPSSRSAAITDMRQCMLDEALAERSWDAIVFDSICSRLGARLPWCAIAGGARGRRASSTSRTITRSPWRAASPAPHGACAAIVKEIDCLKVMRPGAASDRGCRSGHIEHAGRLPPLRRGLPTARPIVFLPPGYGGRAGRPARSTPDVPRRAILVGSLDWPPKRVSHGMLSWPPPRARCWRGPASSCRSWARSRPAISPTLRRRFPSVDFVGRVDDVRPYMRRRGSRWCRTFWAASSSRGWITCSTACPSLSMRIALPGMPLEEGRSIGLFDSHAARWPKAWSR